MPIARPPVGLWARPRTIPANAKVTSSHQMGPRTVDQALSQLAHHPMSRALASEPHLPITAGSDCTCRRCGALWQSEHRHLGGQGGPRTVPKV